MNKRQRYLGRWDLGVLILCGAFTLLAIGAAGENGRRRAKEIGCQANLHEWHGVLQKYIDPNGRFISGDQGSPGYWWVAYLSDQDKDWKRTKIWFCPTNSGPVVDESGRAARELTIFNAWGVFKIDYPNLGPNGVAGSYGLNGYVIPLDQRNGAFRPPRTYESGVAAVDGWRDLRAVPNASTVPMFVEALRFDLWPQPTEAPASNEWAAWTGSMMSRCCINRHDGAVNCLFVDGSVRKVGLKELWTLKWHQSFNTTGPWTKAGGVLPTDWPEWIRPLKDY